MEFQEHPIVLWQKKVRLGFAQIGNEAGKNLGQSVESRAPSHSHSPGPSTQELALPCPAQHSTAGPARTHDDAIPRRVPHRPEGQHPAPGAVVVVDAQQGGQPPLAVPDAQGAVKGGGDDTAGACGQRGGVGWVGEAGQSVGFGRLGGRLIECLR